MKFEFSAIGTIFTHKDSLHIFMTILDINSGKKKALDLFNSFAYDLKYETEIKKLAGSIEEYLREDEE